MTGIILYQSKYGATKQYATWLSEETGFPCVETGQAALRDVQQYDVIILGGGVYASGIAGLSFLKKHIGALADKKIILFCDGASPYDPDAFDQLIQHNLKGPLQGLPCFYCRGAWHMDKMKLMDKKLCRMLQKSVAKKDPTQLAVWEKALLEAGEAPHDWTDKSDLRPILDAIGRL